MTCAIAVFVLLLAAGCAGPVKTFELLPRGGGERGTGRIDLNDHAVRAEIGARSYAGRMNLHEERVADAVLLGTDGQLRCDLRFGLWLASGNGVCTDAQNRQYDLLIK